MGISLEAPKRQFWGLNMQENDGQSEFEEPRIKSQKIKNWRSGAEGGRATRGPRGGGSFASRLGLSDTNSLLHACLFHSNRLRSINVAAWAPPTCFRALRDTCWWSMIRCRLGCQQSSALWTLYKGLHVQQVLHTFLLHFWSFLELQSRTKPSLVVHRTLVSTLNLS